jgi:hypothetical protein
MERKRVTDLKKLRRDYLKRKGYALTRLSVVSVMLASLWGLTEFLVLPLFAQERTPDPDHIERWNALMGALMTLAICGAPTYFCWKWLKKIETNIANLPYVPPVTLDNLPADEVLIRASQEPMGRQSEVLVRAAHEQRQATLQEELLRVSQE